MTAFFTGAGAFVMLIGGGLMLACTTQPQTPSVRHLGGAALLWVLIGAALMIATQIGRALS